ncbi:MAG TPA: ATP-grasp domain-containing protein, partial [Acidimicrobiales bacterium]|nr:ATP-grasp domain-containing protein [Acidimicrobiales bacterium]
MRRVVLILPSGTYRAQDFLAAARALDVEVVVASDEAQAMSGAMGERALLVDLCDASRGADAIVALARRHDVDAVVAVDDQGVEVAARAARSLGLRHNPPDAVMATRDKAVMRERLAHAGVPQPDYAVAREGEAAGAAVGLGFPAVVKPTGLSASRGVIRVDDADEARRAEARIRDLLVAAGRERSEPLLVERFVGGPEVAVEALLENGIVR